MTGGMGFVFTRQRSQVRRFRLLCFLGTASRSRNSSGKRKLTCRSATWGQGSNPSSDTKKPPGQTPGGSLLSYRPVDGEGAGVGSDRLGHGVAISQRWGYRWAWHCRADRIGVRCRAVGAIASPRSLVLVGRCGMGRLTLAIASVWREAGTDPPAPTNFSIGAGRGDRAKPGYCPVLGASRLAVSPQHPLSGGSS